MWSHHSLPTFDRIEQPPLDYRLPSSLERAIWPTMCLKGPAVSTLSPEKRVADPDLNIEPDIKKSKPFEGDTSIDVVVFNDFVGVDDVGDGNRLAFSFLLA